MYHAVKNETRIKSMLTSVLYWLPRAAAMQTGGLKPQRRVPPQFWKAEARTRVGRAELLCRLWGRTCPRLLLAPGGCQQALASCGL